MNTAEWKEREGMEKRLMSGNEAIARGAYEAGVRFCSAYPGTPSTEIFENLPQYKDVLHCEWAPNEKVAVESSYGAAMAGVRSICAMKHVGLNVAADAMFTASYDGLNGGMIIVSADDPSMHSSQNEQDNRHYAIAAKIACLEPSDSQECKDFVKYGFEISEKYDMPVMLRTTTRVSHSKSIVTLGEREEQEVKPYKRDADRFVSTPAHACKHHPEVEANLAALEKYACDCPLNRMEINGSKVGVVTASISYQYAKEVFPEDTSFLKLGLTNPLPIELIREFASKVDKLYVVEELDGIMEQQMKAAGIDCIGKELVSNMFELNPERLREEIFGEKPNTVDPGVEPVGRPPALCPGCPHRGFFYTMSKIKNAVICGDIGCYTLGCAAPLNAMDSCFCMGGGFSGAVGMAKAFEETGQDKVVFGVLGDSTFFHSGMTGAAEIIYNNANVIPVVLDNSITAMTGQQDNPGTGYNLEGDIASRIKIEDVLHALGFTNVIIVDPQDLNAMKKAAEDAMNSTEKSAIITRRPCAMLKRVDHHFGTCTVDRDTCIGCKKCLSVGCPAVMIRDGKSMIDPELCVGCTVCAQVCPVHAIRREDQ